MDMFFLVLLVVLTLVLLTVYVLNNVPQTGDLMKVFATLTRQNPSTVAFSLGYDRHRGQYRNVYTRSVVGTASSEREAYVVLEPNPVNLDGRYVMVTSDKDHQRHGAITDRSNGFSVAGVNGTFSCPYGYEGPMCQLKPLCTTEECDSTQTKLLTYTQFNALNLYKNTFSHGSADLVEDNGSRTEQTHPRIRVQCLPGGSYELQACPDNKLLDPETVQCREYDICQDRVDGYKHNYNVDSALPTLREDEYFMCVGNQSVRKKCNDNTLYSATNHGCIVESVCFGRGKSQVQVDDHNYIQCSGDTGHKVFCEQGILKSEQTLSCIVKTCEPYKLRYNDGVLNYVYAQNICHDNDEAELTLCDNTPVQKRYVYSWAVPFELSLANWPTNVLDESTRTCIEPTDDIILDTATADLSWSPAMHASHKFNIKRQEYVCPAGEYKYRWDYIAGTVVPPPEKADAFVDAAAPCQSSAVDRDQTAWWLLANSPVGSRSVEQFPSDTQPPLVHAVRLTIDYVHDFWPVYDVAAQKYTGSVCAYDTKKREVQVTRFTDTVPPLGFAPVKMSDCGNEAFVPIELVGYPGFPVRVLDDYKMYTYYFVASGKTEYLQFTPGALRTHVKKRKKWFKSK